MGTYEHWPYSNLHDLNLDWVLQIIGDFKRQYENLTEYFNGLIAQLDEKTQEEIAEFEEAISGFETTLRNLASQLEADIGQAGNTASANVQSTEAASLQNIASLTGDELTAIQNKGAEVIESIPQDYSQFYGVALKATTNGTAPNCTTDLNTNMFLIHNGIVACDPNMGLANGPVTITAGDYYVFLLNLEHNGVPAGSGYGPAASQLIYLHKISDDSISVYERIYHYDPQNQTYTFDNWHQVV